MRQGARVHARLAARAISRRSRAGAGGHTAPPFFPYLYLTPAPLLALRCLAEQLDPTFPKGKRHDGRRSRRAARRNRFCPKGGEPDDVSSSSSSSSSSSEQSSSSADEDGGREESL